MPGSTPHPSSWPRFLIYTLKFRNRRNPQRISNLHFSNLYKIGAFSLDRLGRSLLSPPPCLFAPLPPALVLIAKWGVRTEPNLHKINDIRISNRPKTPFDQAGLLGGRSLPVGRQGFSSDIAPAACSGVLTPEAYRLISNRELQLLEAPVSYRKQRAGTRSNREKTRFHCFRPVHLRSSVFICGFKILALGVES